MGRNREKFCAIFCNNRKHQEEWTTRDVGGEARVKGNGNSKRGNQSPLRPWQTKTHCCRHKCFPICPRAQHLLRTQILCPGHKKLFLILFRNILCPQQMFPSFRSPINIMGNNVSTKMCPRLPGPSHLPPCLNKNINSHRFSLGRAAFNLREML